MNGWGPSQQSNTLTVLFSAEQADGHCWGVKKQGACLVLCLLRDGQNYKRNGQQCMPLHFASGSTNKWLSKGLFLDYIIWVPDEVHPLMPLLLAVPRPAAYRAFTGARQQH